MKKKNLRASVGLKKKTLKNQEDDRD